jgi:hypothetical protein
VVVAGADCRVRLMHRPSSISDNGYQEPVYPGIASTWYQPDR